MKTSGQRWLHVARIGVRVLSLAVLAPSVLLGVRAPNYPLWMLRVGLIEWGHSYALGLLALLVTPTVRRVWGWLIWPVSLLTGLLYLSPLARAIPLARRLPRQLREAFGEPGPHPNHQIARRQTPISIVDLLHPLAWTRTAPRRIAYYTDEHLQLELDLYLPGPIAPTAQSSPLVVVIHGGAWEGGDSAQLPDINHYLAARGYAVAALNYRLSPQHPYPAAYDDVLKAIAYVKNNAEQFGIDPHRIVVLGRSSGGHLALLSAYRAADPAIRGVIALYPPTDLRGCYDFPRVAHVLDGWGVLERFLGGTPEDVPERYDEASPVQYVGANTPPTLLVHGELDEIVGVCNSEWLAERLRAAARPHYFLRLPWATHGCDANLSSPSGQLILYAVEHFLGAVSQPTLQGIQASSRSSSDSIMPATVTASSGCGSEPARASSCRMP